MKCPKCECEMKYFRDYESGKEGYRCEKCGTERGIPVYVLEEG